MAQFSGEFTYVYHAIPVELYFLCPKSRDIVGSLFNHILPTICVGSSELGELPVQHADVPVRQLNFLAKYTFRFQLQCSINK